MGDADGSGILSDLLMALQSPLAMWIYSWVAIAASFILSTAFAVYQLGITRSFQAADMLKRFKGRPPQTDAAVKSRIAKLNSHAQNVTTSLIGRSLLMFVFGIVVPGAILAVIAWYQTYLLPGEPAIAVAGLPADTKELNTLNLTLFIADQALRGGLSDLFEVFGFSLGNATNNPANTWFSTFVLAYRLLCGAIVVGIAYMVLRVAFGLSTLRAFINGLSNGTAASSP